MLKPAIRWLASNGSGRTARVLVSCRVKPGVSAAQEGIAAVTDECVEVGVTNQARDGSANKGVIAVIAKALGMPRTDVTLWKGHKSREKVIAVNIQAKGTPEDKLIFVRSVLQGNVLVGDHQQEQKRGPGA
jgi:uncharacterized protein YggU (UPF0235/DUF167 family)